MEEERAYVDWLRGQEAAKDTKPTTQMVTDFVLREYVSNALYACL